MKFHESTIKIDNFSEMGLNPTLLTALEKMRVTTPTPIQSQATPAALDGLDIIGIAQTGSGKTLTYALAIMTHLEKYKNARALILTPNRENAEQVHRVFMALSAEMPMSLCLIAAGIAKSSFDKGKDSQASQLKKNPRIIIATPGRMSEHLRNNKLLMQGLSVLVIDEADRMLDLGFKPQLEFIKSTLRGEWQTLMFAASFGPKSEPIAKLFMKDEAVMIRASYAEKPVATLSQKVFFLTEPQKNNRLMDELKRMKGSIMIFADSQQNCVSLGRFLTHHELSCDFVHGDMNPGHRNRVLREFREQKIQIMVTTDLLARGLDIEHVMHIVNYDLPFKSEDFLHRIGRTARAGREGSAMTFVTPADGRTYRKIKTYLDGAEKETLTAKFKFDDKERTKTDEA
jgi:superfamily II DNA/RNA helicase